MADVKISELPALTSPDGAEELVVNDGGTTKKITIDNLFNQDIDVTGTVTADGLVVDGNPVIKGLSPQLFLQTGNGNYNFQIAAQESVNNAFEISSGGTDITAPNNTYTKRVVVKNNGDISFYEDTGTTAKFFWDSSAESLGIGNVNPAAKLEVTATPNATSGAIARVRDSYATSSNASFGGIEFSSSPSYDYSIGKANVNSSSTLSFRNATTGASLMDIDNTGNVMVGKSVTTQSTAGTTLYPSGQIYATADNTQPMVLTRKSGDGPITLFYKDATEVGRIGVGASELFIGSGDAYLWTSGNNNSFLPASTSVGGASNGLLDLGSSGRQFKDLHLGGGVYLGGTGAAHKLDDYEFGTFTATLRGGTEPSTKLTVASRYTKIGRAVTFHISFENQNTTGYAGQITIDGLPFTNTGSERCPCPVTPYSTITWTDDLVSMIDKNATTITFHSARSNNTYVSANHATAGAVKYLWVTGTYTTE